MERTLARKKVTRESEQEADIIPIAHKYNEREVRGKERCNSVDRIREISVVF